MSGCTGWLAVSLWAAPLDATGWCSHSADVCKATGVKDMIPAQDRMLNIFVGTRPEGM